jgi:hypothetical protein
MGIAKANKKLVEFTVQQEMVSFEETIFTKVKNFRQLRNQILISKKADTIADKRYLNSDIARKVWVLQI